MPSGRSSRSEASPQRKSQPHSRSWRKWTSHSHRRADHRRPHRARPWHSAPSPLPACNFSRAERWISRCKRLTAHCTRAGSHLQPSQQQHAGRSHSNRERPDMLNLYAVTVWHASAPRHAEMIEVRTYTARRAEHLASESFPGCSAAAELLAIENRSHREVARPGMSTASEVRAPLVVRHA